MPWPVVLLGDLLVVGGLVVLTLALAGIWRFPDLFARIHATAKIGSLGLVALLLGSLATGDVVLVVRSLLIALFLVLTAPVASYVVARAAHGRERITTEPRPGDPPARDRPPPTPGPGGPPPGDRGP